MHLRAGLLLLGSDYVQIEFEALLSVDRVHRAMQLRGSGLQALGEG